MDTAEIVGSLVELDLLRPVQEDLREPLAKAIAEVSECFDVEEGKTVLVEGHLGFGCGYVMLTGTADIERGGSKVTGLESPTLLGEMSQFLHKDVRGASVTTTSAAAFLQFDWDELYAHLTDAVGEAPMRLFRAAVERLVLRRFRRPELLKLPLFDGLSDDLKYKACVVFPWVTEMVEFEERHPLFHAATLCQSKGYLLVEGTVQLSWPDDKGEKQLNAPDIIGVMPKQDPARKWSAHAVAASPVKVLTFSWTQYIDLLSERLSKEEQHQLVSAFKENRDKHFWH